MSEKKEITRATTIMGLATGLSRVAGLVRDMVVASLFGAGFATDAFFMAFTLPNLLRRFFAEGSLTAAFVPTFSGVLHHDGREEALKVARTCLTLLLLTMTVVVLAGIVFSPWLVRAIGFGFESVEGKLALTDALNRLMFPYILLVSVLALLTGILNVFGHYFLPSVSPLFLNLMMILAAISLRHYFAVPITALAIGVLVGGVVQLLVQLPALRRHGVRLGFRFNFGQPAVRKIVRLMIPGLAGVAIYQINIVVSRLLASFLPEGSVSYLYYGQRLFEFPQGIFIVSLAQAVLPALSRQMALEDREGFRESFNYALALVLFITLPAGIGLTLCAVPIYSLFFLGGAFSPEDVRQTAVALMAYAPGILFVGVSRIIVPTFYALHDTRTPVWISFWTFLANAGLGWVMMQWWHHVGLALALTAASVFNASLLLWALRRKMGPLGLSSLMLSLIRMIPAAILMGGAVWGILTTADWYGDSSRWWRGGILGIALLSGVAVYGGSCLLFRVPEATAAWGLLQKKWNRTTS